MNPIAMKCTKEQYNKIKPILLENGFEEENVTCFEQHPYLINNWGPEDYKLGNGDLCLTTGRRAFHEWNENIFLEHCDIKTDFVLPEKWCIKQSANDISCNWFNNKFKVKSNTEGGIKYLVNYKSSYKSPYESNIPIGYTEITFEQFKKYVLKQEEEPLFEVGTQFRHRRNNSLDYTISSINNNQVEVSWNNNKSSTFYSLTDTTHFFKNKIWIKKEPEYKYTPEYCRNNKVAIFVKTQSDIDGLNQLDYKGHIVILNNYPDCFYTVPKNLTWGIDRTYFNKNYKVINASDFIKNNLKTTNMEKKIIGYKLIKPEYKGAALNLCRVTNFSNSKDYDFVSGSINYNKLKEAGVLDLWFAPVYEQSETKYTMGSNGNTFELIVKDGRCFHKQEDITNYVKEIQKRYELAITNNKFCNYDFNVKDIIIISKTGCESKETLLSQWLNIKL